MAEVSTITSVISTVGFPIAMCIALLWYIYKQSESHKDESKAFTEALNNNTIAVQKLCDMLGVEREG